jgi:flavin-dependent dehydrogenase
MSVLVIGGGLAGAGVAIGLARAGRRVVLVEKEAGPHDKVCGEFLSYEAVASLRRLGLDPLALGAATVDRLAVSVGARRMETALPFTALSLSRRVLDEALLARAVDVGVDVRRGVRVTSLEPGWTARTESGGALSADTVLLATGKHDLRGWKRPPGRQPDLIGFKTHLTLARLLPRTVELRLFPGGYAGLEPVEDGRANLCLVVRRSSFGGWEALWAALAASWPALAGAVPESPKPLAIAAIPYGHVQTRSNGLWRLGDQAAVIPSFAGEGMAIALHSAELAARMMLAGDSADSFQRTLARHVRAQVAGATAMSQLLVRPAAQGVIGAALSAAPGLARLVAKRTRLPATAQHLSSRP